MGDHNRARDGTDVISGTEVFQFSDGTKTPSQLAITGVVTGDARTVIAIRETFFGVGPSQSQYAAALDMVASAGASQFALGVGNSFAATDSASLSAAVLANFGLSPGTLGGGDPDASFAALQDALTTIFSTYASARGQVVLNIGNLLAGLEADSVYGQAAAAFQNMMAADFSSVSAGLVGVAAQEASATWA